MMSGRGGARKRDAEKSGDEDYALKRKRNNDAVNKTRQKKRQEENETSTRVDDLRAENAQLERKVESLQKELTFLKEMFVAYANGNGNATNTASSSIGSLGSIGGVAVTEKSTEDSIVRKKKK